jgi:DNA-binding response OmpR family regulator
MTTAADSPTILVVDDDRDCRDIAARLLDLAGYRTRRAESGADCLRTIDSEAIDLVLLDVMMPEMDGFEVCAALAARGKRIPVILLTARDDVDTRLEGMHHGVSEFLTKPINKHELYARVRAQLHILELARQLDTVERKVQGLGATPAARPPSRT